MNRLFVLMVCIVLIFSGCQQIAVEESVKPVEPIEFEENQSSEVVALEVKRQLTVNFNTIAVGSYFGLAIKEDGSLWAWGNNGYGQIGDGSNINRNTSVKIMDDVAAVAAGGSHSLAIKTDGSLWAWGNNEYGQLGDGTDEDKNIPVKIMDDVAAVAAGARHSLAVGTDGSLWAWGANSHAQCDGNFVYAYQMRADAGNINGNKNTPVKVMDNVASVAAGDMHTLALKTDGSLWVWGFNGDGQIGRGEAGGAGRYGQAKTMDDVAFIATAGGQSLAIKVDGSLWAWGNNEYGQINGVTTKTRTKPVKVMDDIVSAATGGEYIIAIKEDGSLWAWGNNEYGQLGDGTDEDKNIPVEIMEGVASVLSIGRRSLAIKEDGSLWAWGDWTESWDHFMIESYEEWMLYEEWIINVENKPAKIMDGVKLP